MKYLTSYKVFESIEESIIDSVKDIFSPLVDFNLTYKIDIVEDSILIDIEEETGKESNINDISNGLLHLMKYSSEMGFHTGIDTKVRHRTRFVNMTKTKRVYCYSDSKFITVLNEVINNVEQIQIELHPKHEKD